MDALDGRILDRSLGLVSIFAVQLSVFISYQATDETMKHTDDFKHETVRIALCGGL